MPRVKKTISVFLSYSTKDNEKLGDIKFTLELFGLDVFLAHEDIEPTKKWRGVIKENLDKCDVFIPFISKNFKNSEWTDQETGYALGQNKIIIPIGTDLSPYGFISDIQAIRYRECNDACLKIIQLIDNSSLRDAFTWCLIRSLKDSKSYSRTEEIMQYINSRSKFSQDQFNLFLEMFVGNSQVYDEWTARKFLERICETMGTEDDSLIKKVQSVYSSLKIRQIVQRKPEKGKALERQIYLTRLPEEEGDYYLEGGQATAGSIISLYIDRVNDDGFIESIVAQPDGNWGRVVILPKGLKLGDHHFWVKYEDSNYFCSHKFVV